MYFACKNIFLYSKLSCFRFLQDRGSLDRGCTIRKAAYRKGLFHLMNETINPGMYVWMYEYNSVSNVLVQWLYSKQSFFIFWNFQEKIQNFWKFICQYYWPSKLYLVKTRVPKWSCFSDWKVMFIFGSLYIFSICKEAFCNDGWQKKFFLPCQKFLSNFWLPSFLNY